MPDTIFDLPFRIYWNPGPAAPAGLVKAVRKSEPLTVILQLKNTDELVRLGLPWDGTSVVAVLHGWEDHKGSLPVEGVDRWEFPVEDLTGINRIETECFFGVSASRTALRWIPRKGGLHMLPEMVRSAARLGCGLTLPNPTVDVITTRGAAAFPDPLEFDEQLMDRVREAAGGLTPKALRVHDYILAKALNLSEAGSVGCQAANSIAFVDEDGVVYPCESFKVALGNLNSMEMGSIWSSPARGEILKEIGLMPLACSTCADLSACRGGCRGAAFHLRGRHGEPDPVCPRFEAHPCE
jgi:radical SAM protein with 4Fe4S-binding SPASM domain